MEQPPVIGQNHFPHFTFRPFFSSINSRQSQTRKLKVVPGCGESYRTTKVVRPSHQGGTPVPPRWNTCTTKVEHLYHQGGTITSCGQIRNFMRGNARLRAGRCTTSAERPPLKGIMPQPVIRLRHLPRIASVMTFPRLLQWGCAYFPNDLNILEMQRFFCSILGWT